MRSEIRMMLALESLAAKFAHVRRARPKAARVGGRRDYPHKIPPCDPADWSDLVVREITGRVARPQQSEVVRI
jgi:hypothetical protein